MLQHSLLRVLLLHLVTTVVLMDPELLVHTQLLTLQVTHLVQVLTSQSLLLQMELQQLHSYLVVQVMQIVRQLQSLTHHLAVVAVLLLLLQ